MSLEIKNFEKWNDDMYQKYGNKDRYKSTNFFIRFNTLSRLKSILRNIPKGGDVLEFGCGAGMILKEIKNYSSLTGVDFSQNAINEAKQNLVYKNNLSLIKGDVQEINLNKSYNTLICAEVLEHLPNPEKVIENIIRHSHKDTKIIITIPYEKNIEGVEKILRLFSHKHVKMDWHIHKFNLNLLRSMLKDKLVIKRVIPTPFFFFPFSYTVICEVKR